MDLQVVVVEFARLAQAMQATDDPREQLSLIHAMNTLMRQAAAEYEQQRQSGETVPGDQEPARVFEAAARRLAQELQAQADQWLADPCNLGKDIFFHHGRHSDLSKPQAIDFYFYFPGPEAAERAAIELRAHGFIANVDSEPFKSRWLCKATRRLVPDQHLLDQWGAWFPRVAAAHDGEYDGWDAEVVR